MAAARASARIAGAGRPLPAGSGSLLRKSRLKLAKNDKLDAALIAAFTANLDALPALPDARFDTLNAELTYLEQIEDQVSVLKTMAETTRAPSLKRLHEKDIARLEKRREARMLLIAALVAKDDELARRRALLVSIKGIGLRTALALVIRLPELGSLSREEIAALTGLAPYDDERQKARTAPCPKRSRQAAQEPVHGR